MKRPMLYWTVLFILGEVLYRLFSVSRIGVFIIAVVIFIYIVMVVFHAKKDIVLWVGIFFFICGTFCFAYQKKQLAISRNLCGRVINVEGSVIQKTEKEQGTEYIVKTKRVDSNRLYTRLLMTCDDSLLLGNTVVLKGEVTAFSRASNPGEYDEQGYRNGTGIFFKLDDVVIVRNEKTGIGFRDKLESLHNGLKAVYDKLFDEQHASLANAMVLGDKALVDADIKKLYQQNGIAHLIAISGLHIAMIGGSLYRLFRKWLGNYNVAAGLGIGFILAYGVMTGLSGSTLRAMIMLITQIGADILGRKYDSITAVSLALCIMLFCNPYQLMQAGFLLSFGAVIGIAVVNPVWKQWFPKLPRIFDGLLVSISVQLTILPVLLYFFYEIPVYGVLLNLIVVPLMGVLLAFLLLCGLVGFINIPLSGLLSIPVKYIFMLYEMLCRFTQHLPFHTVCSGRPAVWWVVCYYVLLALLVWAGFQKKKGFPALCLVILLGFGGLFAAFWMPGSLKICMFDVGQGDGIYVRTPDKLHILVDGGSSTQLKVGTYILKNGVKYHGAGSLDYVFVSHLDSDHYSGVRELLESGEITVRNLVLPHIANPDDAYHELEALAKKAGCKLFYMKRGDSMQAGNVCITCLHPVNREYSDKNSGSLVFLLTYHEFDMLFTGDMTEEVEQEILPDIKKGIEVLKVAHHGSKTASCEAFIKQLSFGIAMVSVGRTNHYGHPSLKVMETLEKYCDKIYLTKDSGAITIDSDGYNYSIYEFCTTNVN